MGHGEIAPPPGLASHVACLWWRRGASSRVLPDGCVDLVWTGADVVGAGPAPRPGGRRAVLGPRARSRVGRAGAGLGLPAGELLDSSAPLGHIWTEGDDLAERAAAASGARGQSALLVGA